ncbi:MAG: M48 family metalloprotease [Oligoflexia bacterium]|nr:M48 family metalloprotease [Oligoflexia bacterium]
MKHSVVFIILAIWLGDAHAANTGTTHSTGKSSRQYIEEAWAFWIPKVDRTLEKKVVPAYNWLEARYGSRVARTYDLIDRNLLQPLRERTDFAEDYWAENTPTWTKKKMSDVYFGLFEYLANNAPPAEAISPDRRAAVEFIKSYMTPSKDVELVRRVNRVFKSLLPYMHDQELAKCQSVRVLESEDWPNSNQTGCVVMITDVYVKMLTDDELAGVLAHELAHEDRGHLVRSYSRVAKETGKRAVQLISDDIVYVLTGHVNDTLHAQSNGRFWNLVLHANNMGALEHEIEADRFGAQMLCRSGRDPMNVYAAIEKVSRALGYDDEKRLNSGESEGRLYPSLVERKTAIEAVSRSCVK